MRAFLRLPSLWPSLVARTRPPEPPPTMTIWWRSPDVERGEAAPGALSRVGLAAGSGRSVRSWRPVSDEPVALSGSIIVIFAAPRISLQRPTVSAHRWHDEVGTGADARGPARRDRLQLGVEADTLGTVHVVVAEQRGLPAAEAVERHRHRDRHVDPDHPDIDLVRELARRVAVAGEDGGAVAELVLVDHAGRRLVIRRAHDRQHRAENLFLVDRHVGRDVVEQRAAQEVAVLVALHPEAAAVN